MKKSLPAALLAFALFSAANAQTAAPADKPNAASDQNALISDFAYSGGNTDAEIVADAAKGVKVYKDSDVTFPDLPAYLNGATFIRPYLADAGEGSSTDQYQLNIKKYSHVYLLIDSANDMPASNDNETYRWQKLTDTLSLNNRTMNIYKSRLMAPYDNVYLATNGHGIDRFDPKSNMYLLFVADVEKPLLRPRMTVSAGSSSPDHPPTLAIDGDPKTYWEPADDKKPQWIKIDIGQTCAFGRYEIDWFKKGDASDANGKIPAPSHEIPKCLIEVSDDDRTYRLSVDAQPAPIKPPGGQTDLSIDTDASLPPADNIVTGISVPPLNVAASKGRYIRITVTGEGWAISELKSSGAPDSLFDLPAPAK